MLTMRSAAALLGAARTIDGLAAMLRGAGLIDECFALTGAERDALGVDVAHASLADVTGATRVLLIRDAAEDLRSSVHRLAGRLASRAPHVLWIIAAVDERGEHGRLSAVIRTDGSFRVASFAWETAHVVDSDAETLCALAAVRADSDVFRHGRCAEVLGRDALTRRFYRQLEARIGALALSLRAPDTDARAVALLYASRLLFLCFVQAKGWLDGDRAFLSSRFDDCMRGGGSFHRHVLLPLFFGTLNTRMSRRSPVARAFGRVPFLNGGLFTRTALERRLGPRLFPDAELGDLLDQVFQRYRFVAREDSTTWSEAAVDPEMLGRAFESLMASTERKAGGVFYTPQHLVARVADEAIAALGEGTSGARLDALRRVRVLDPACGSGSFLVYVLEHLADARQRAGERRDVSAIRRDVLATSVFGVDRDPTAVWLCELRLWLSVVIESETADPLLVPPLPNLDRNIRVGDALLGPAFSRDPITLVGSRAVIELRQRYVRATGKRKEALARVLDREERSRVLAQLDRDMVAARHSRREQLLTARSRDLFGNRGSSAPDARRTSRELKDRLRDLRNEWRRVRDGGALPFSFAALFPEAQAGGGFDAVLGNPPWVRIHRIPGAMRDRLRERYLSFRAAPWLQGRGRNGAGFASQVDLAGLFVERSLALARPEGVVSLLLPVKLWRSLAGGGLRQLLIDRSRLVRVEDLSESRHAFDAAVYPSLLVTRAAASPAPHITLGVHARDAYREWTTEVSRLPFDATAGAPWLLLDPGARAAFQHLRSSGIPLATALGAPRLGVKSGCNAAFVVKVQDSSSDVAWIVDPDGERGKVEAALLRPALRGDAVLPWSSGSCGEWIVWTHDEHGPLARLPTHAGHWLRRRYDDLSRRTDAARAKRWWSLFRVEAANPRSPRVVWADFGRRPRALVLPAGNPAVPLNSCYVLPCATEDDAWAVAALINSPVAAAWLNALAEPARGGYRRYLGWTVAQLPVPRDWDRARPLLAEAAAEARENVATSDDRLTEAVLRCFGVRKRDLAPLLATL